MLEVQKFAIDNIYCVPGQDRQFAFQMVRVNKIAFPVKTKITVYNAVKRLPDNPHLHHVFTVGNLPPRLLNLLSQGESWFKDQWIKVSDDMVLRDYIMKVYNEEGVMYPRDCMYYSFIDQNSLLIALEIRPGFSQTYPTASFKYFSVYSNAYFQSAAHQTQANKIGIDYLFTRVSNNQQKVDLQNFVLERKSHGGDVFIYLDGLYSDNINLNIPNLTQVEIVYDQSVKSRELYNISTLRTFDSLKDNRLKYFVYRDTTAPYIEYNDETELYVAQSTGLVKKGLHFYKHQDYVMRNVTDKDYSLTSAFVNTTAQALSAKVGGALTDKQVVLYMRHAARPMSLTYSAMKLHELYKLPRQVQEDAISNSSYSLDIFRAEHLENSPYFQVASASNVQHITSALALQAVGYNALSYYLANTPVAAPTQNIEVPELYQAQSIAFEYDAQGLYMGRGVTYGPLYSRSAPEVAFVDFQHGYEPANFGTLLSDGQVVSLLHPDDDYSVLMAYHEDQTKVSSWTDITNTAAAVQTGNNLTLTLPLNHKARIVYLKQVNIMDLDVTLNSGVIYFPLTERINKGLGPIDYLADLPPQSMSVYLNRHRLTHGVDYFVSFPYVCITNKKYLAYAQSLQNIHVRMSSFVLDTQKINELEVKGFVNSGVLTRNRYYDIRDDRVFAVYVDGKLTPRSSVLYSEEDSTIRLTNPKNGVPYTLDEKLIPMKFLSGQSSQSLFLIGEQKNKKISEFFNLVMPEPVVNEFNAILTAHYIYSPTVAKMINDMLSGILNENTYTNPYDDGTILTLLDGQYRMYFQVDPIRFNMPDVLVEIHPHIGNTTISLNLPQYRFILNVIRVMTNNNPSKINISGYLTVTA